MSIKYYPWLSLLLIITLSACYPKGAVYTDELSIVYTNHASGFDFKSQRTYAIPDSVIKITGDVINDPDGNGKPQFLSANYSKAIIDQLKQNMANDGWTLIDKNGNPDVLLLPSSMTTTNVYYYYDWSYWDWWYPGWWDWYYPSYYYPPYVSGYRSGSVFIQMLSIKNVPAGENAPVIWNSILNGLAEGNTTDLISRAQTGINKAFAQSPYLNIK